MAFCRGCGQTLHDSAVACPHCGAQQRGPAPKWVALPAAPPSEGSVGWSVAAIVVASIGLLGGIALADAPRVDKDQAAGAVLLGVIACVLATIGLLRDSPPKALNIASIVMGVIVGLIGLGALC